MNSKNCFRNSQLRLIRILASGATLNEAAAILKVSINTVRTRVKTLYTKFGVNNRADLIKQAVYFEIINFKDIKPRFRRRFINIKIDDVKPTLREPLTVDELKYLTCLMRGMSQKEIVKKLPLSGIFHARILVISICYKLGARNITEAAANISELENILKPTF